MTQESRYESEINGAHVLVEFKSSSSSRDGKDGYRVVVTERATEDMAQEVIDLAAALRRRAMFTLAAPVEVMEAVLDARAWMQSLIFELPLDVDGCGSALVPFTDLKVAVKVLADLDRALGLTNAGDKEEMTV